MPNITARTILDFFGLTISTKVGSNSDFVVDI